MTGPSRELRPGRHPDPEIFASHGLLGVCRLEEGVGQRRTSKGLIKEIRIVEIFGAEDDLPRCGLALRTDRGWFLSSDGPIVTQGGDKRAATLESLEVLGSPERPIVMMRWWQDCNYPASEERTEILAICGLGPTGNPGCSWLDIGGTKVGDERFRWTWRLRAKVSATGTITIEKGLGEPPAAARALPGQHVLRVR